MPSTIQVALCPIYEVNGTRYWVNCPSYEWVQEPVTSPPDIPFGCCHDKPIPGCPVEIREIASEPEPEAPISLASLSCKLSAGFPNFAKLPRQTAQCPMVVRGLVEELHSRECRFIDFQGNTHLIRIYLLIVTPPNGPQVYRAVGFEVDGYDPATDDTLPLVMTQGGLHPDYFGRFSGMDFCILLD